MKNEKIDIVIPLGSESFSSNLELRLALRSIDRFAAGAGQIWIVGDTVPDWLQNVRIVTEPDRHFHNKDANIIDKLLTAANQKDLSERFIFWSDDQAALHRFIIQDMQPVFNRRSRKYFTRERMWHRRMRRTFDFLAQQGKNLHWNWDSHVPQIMQKSLFKKIMAGIDYQTPEGYCVNTLYFGLTDTPPRLEQSRIKTTCETAQHYPYLPRERLFIGYNDAACRGNILQLLQEYLPAMSVYERQE